MTSETFFASRRAPLLAGLVIFAAALAAYANSFGAPFVFDDKPAIEENLTIRDFWNAWSPPPGALPVSGRPVMNLSLALNYAISGNNPWSYHALNLLIHIAAGLTLFGIVRRTIGWSALPSMRFSAGDAAQRIEGNALHPLIVAFAAALLWTLHPLQTESVTYISQRAESLMGLFYLLTLYGFIRGAEIEGDRERRCWFALSILACLLGMLTKEVMVSAPLMVLLYDRTFLSGSFREAWRRRRNWLLALAGTWILLGWSVASAGMTRGATSGFAIQEPWWAYWLTQFEAVAHYLWLSFWPSPLVIYYEAFWVRNPLQALPYALVVIPLAAGTVWALWRKPAAGFLGAWLFAMLAPTSLVPNAIQMIAEHRMYLPLAAVALAAVLGIFAVLDRKPAFSLCVAAALALGIMTIRRNRVYQSDLALWTDTVAKMPGNTYAHNNLGNSLLERGLVTEALAQYRQAVGSNPDTVYAYMNIGSTLGRMGRLPEAIASYQQALRLKPDWPSIHNDLADVLTHANRLREAISQYQQALRLKPGFPQAEDGLGAALMRSGDVNGAMAHFQAALRMNPDYPEAHNNFGAALATVNRLPEAISHFEQAVRLKPDYPEAHLSLGNAYFQANRLDDAIREYQEALHTQPGSPETYDHFGILLAEAGQLPEAEEQFKHALRLKPYYLEAQGNLQQVQAAERAKAGK